MDCLAIRGVCYMTHVLQTLACLLTARTMFISTSNINAKTFVEARVDTHKELQKM